MYVDIDIKCNGDVYTHHDQSMIIDKAINNNKIATPTHLFAFEDYFPLSMRPKIEVAFMNSLLE